MAVFPSSQDVRPVDHPEPVAAGPHQVKLRVREAAICGADREIASFASGVPPVDSSYRKAPLTGCFWRTRQYPARRVHMFLSFGGSQ